MTDEIMTLRTLLEKSSDGYDRVSQPFWLRVSRFGILSGGLEGYPSRSCCFVKSP